MHARRLLVTTACLAIPSLQALAQEAPTHSPAPAAQSAPPDAASQPPSGAQPLPEVEVVQPKAAAGKSGAGTAGQLEKTGSGAPERTAQKKAKPPEPAVAPPPQSVAAPGVASEAPQGTLNVSRDVLDAVTTTSTQELQAKQGQTITDALATKPGVAASTFAPGASRPILRGLDNNRVRVQEDGIGTHDVSMLSEDHAIPVDPYSADRIEIIQGPATLRYGGPAIGGVVAIENGRIPTVIPMHGLSGAISGGLSSVDDGRDGAFRVNAGADGIVVHADGFRRQADDYDTPRGIEENTFVDSQGGAVGASFVGSDGFLGAAYAHVDSRYGIPDDDVHIDLVQDKVQSKGEWRLGHGGIDTLRFWFGASDYAHNEVAPDGEVGSRFTSRDQEARAEIEQQPISTALGDVRGVWGAYWGHGNLRGQSFEGSSLLEPAETDRVAGFVFQTLALTERLKLLAAGRIERVTVDGTGLLDFSDPLNLVSFTGERQFTPLSFSAGLAYDIGNATTVRLTGQYVERAPEAAELFSQGLHEATETFEIGNTSLGKEAARTLEVGVKKGDGRLRLDASAYLTHFDGFIAKELTGVKCGDTIDTCGIEDDLDQVLFQQRDARFYGVEIVAQYDVGAIGNGVWGVDAQYDFVNARFDDGENVQRIPPHRLGGGLYYHDANWLARAGLLHAFDQDRIGANETPTKGYTLVSAELSRTWSAAAGEAAPEYTVGIKGENLADDDVRNHASFKKDEVLLPGASVRLFGTLKLN